MGEFDYNARIVAPQEWLHLLVPFGLADKDLSMAKLMYGYLDIMQVASNKQQGVMSTHLMTLMHLAPKYKINGFLLRLFIMLLSIALRHD